MTISMSITEARARLPEVVDRVLAGEEITLTRHGASVAVVVRPDVLALRRASAASDLSLAFHDRIEAARGQPLKKAVLTSERAEELVGAVRLSRKRR